MNISFYKENDNRWYADIPAWTGEKADLEMVCGADTMLDILSQGDFAITLNIEPSVRDNKDVLYFIAEHEDGGAFYQIEYLKGIKYDFTIWLCDVTKFVFGEFPKAISL